MSLYHRGQLSADTQYSKDDLNSNTKAANDSWLNTESLVSLVANNPLKCFVLRMKVHHTSQRSAVPQSDVEQPPQ